MNFPKNRMTRFLRKNDDIRFFLYVAQKRRKKQYLSLFLYFLSVRRRKRLFSINAIEIRESA